MFFCSISGEWSACNLKAGYTFMHIRRGEHRYVSSDSKVNVNFWREYFAGRNFNITYRYFSFACKIIQTA